METKIGEFEQIGEVIMVYGQDIIKALLILVVGLIAAKLLVKVFRKGLERFLKKPTVISTASNIFYILLLMVVAAIAMGAAGIDTIVIRRMLDSVGLAAIALIIILRPYLPTLPFKVGNTIEAGGLLGKVEAVTALNTRLRTFDGKTVFVPNTKILNDNVINFHFTPNRQIRLEILISYRDDLLKAKHLLFEILAQDPRVIDVPRPSVYVLNLAENGIEIAGRAWVKNLDYWRTRCDLLEKVVLRFDQEGITIPFPQRHIHFNGAPAAIHGLEQ